MSVTVVFNEYKEEYFRPFCTALSLLLISLVSNRILGLTEVLY